MNAQRRGYTLVEVLLVLGILSTILGTIGITMNVLFRSTLRVQDRMDYQQQVQRFADQFRGDVHAAQRTELSESAGSDPVRRLRLVQPQGRVVEYQIDEHEARIVRRVREGERIEHRETYRLVAASETGWTIVPDRERPLVRVEVLPAAASMLPGEAAARGVVIQAVAGLVGPPHTAIQP